MSSTTTPSSTVRAEPAVVEALALRDLTDPALGLHAVQCVVDRLEDALAGHWHLPVRRDPGPRTVLVADNYDALNYSPDAATRDRRYTRYVGGGRMLRSHTSARIPALLRRLAVEARSMPALEIVLSVPGITYRRDVIDRSHVGEPHQVDLWRIRAGGPALTGDDLHAMIGLVVEAVLPGHVWRSPPSPHPYTLAGREILVRADGREVEIGECGLAHPGVLAAAGLPPTASGLAMGLGLDRLVMLAKGIDDIRLLRSTDPRIAAQLLDLTPYRPVSAQPAARRDLSLAVPDEMDAELLGDRVRGVLGTDAAAVEEVLVRAETGHDELPEGARRRLGIQPGQKNVLVRLVLRSLDHTLTSADANALRDRVYASVHQGVSGEWTAVRPALARSARRVRRPSRAPTQPSPPDAGISA
jgi:phenylalanyl-tRNA synthetase alpha chain